MRRVRLLLTTAALALVVGGGGVTWAQATAGAVPSDSLTVASLALDSLAAVRPPVVWAPVPGVLLVAADAAGLTSFAAAPAAPAVETPGALVGTGRASYYGEQFRGRRTASGQRFDPDALTAAHRTLPFGTRLRVTNVANGRSVVVRVTDRGPFHRSRILDLSKEAARRIGMVRSGTGRVRIERL